nr:hypothetical protein [Tanacetum cinerariifolium]
MEAHCVNLELKYQNQALKDGQHGQFSKVKSKEAKIKHDIDVIETINIELEHKMAKLLKENESLKRHYKELSVSIKTTRAKTIKHTTSLIVQNAEFKAQLQKRGFATAALKNKLGKLPENSVNTKFAKSSILGKPVYNHIETNQLLDNRLLTTHYLPKERESAVVKSHHVIASKESRNSSKNMPRFSSNDMVRNHYLEEAKKKTQERGRNSEPSVMPSARLQSTSNEVNSRAKFPSNKTTNKNKPVEKTSLAKKPERQIPKGHKFSIKKTSVVHEKTMTLRSCLRWKPTGKIFKTVGLRWVPTGKIFNSSTIKVDSEPPNGSNEDITNQYEYEQTLDVSAGTSFNPKKEGLRVWLLKRLISPKPGLQGILI